MIPTMELPIFAGPTTVTYPARIIFIPDVIVSNPEMLLPVPIEGGPWDLNPDTTGCLRWKP